MEYVENGGHLVYVGAYAKLDEHLLPLNLLGIQAPSGIVDGSFHVKLFDGGSFESFYLYDYENFPVEAITVARQPIR